MYEAYYGLSHPLLNGGLTAGELFRCDALDEAHARLKYLVEIRGIGLLLGESGAGKTTAQLRLRDDLHPDKVRPLYLHDTAVNGADFYRQVALELGIEPHWSRAMTLRAVQQEVTRLVTERGLTVLLVVDEAHRLRPDVLSELPLLTNFAWDSDRRLALLLAGHTSLRSRLRMAVMEPLTQRITVRYTLGGLNRDDTRAYVEHRLRIAGVDRPLLSEPAIEALHNASGGIMRRIDLLTHHALAAAAAAKARIVDADHVRQAAEEIRP